MSSSSIVTYTSVYTDFEPGRVIWGANEELSDGGSPRVIVYGYDGLPMQPVPYAPEPEYPEYLVPSDDEAPMEDQPLPSHASPIALSPGYVVDSDLEEDLEEDPKEDHADYPAGGGDDDDEPSNDDDDDTGDEDEEPFKDEEDDEKGEEHLAPADSPDVPVIDHVPLAEDIEAFKTDEAAPIHVPSPRRHMARISVRPQTPVPLPSGAERPLQGHELPPYKRLCLTALTSRYEVGESLTTAPRPTGGHGADYGFISTMDAEVRRQRAEEVSYGIRDVWVDPTETVEKEALVSQEAWAHSIGLSSAVHYELQAYRTHTQMQDYHIASQESPTTTLIAHVSSLQGQLSASLGQIQALQARDQTHVDDHEGVASTANNMPPRRTFATARAADTAATPMTAAVVEQLIEARVSAALANHDTLRNSTNGHGDRSHNSDTRIRGTVRTPLRKDGIGVPYQQLCYGEPKTVKILWGLESKIKKLEIELWNLKVKGTDIASYTLRFQELALMCGRMFHEEWEEVEKYVGGLPNMIRGNDVISAEDRFNLACNCRSSGPNGDNNNRGNFGTTQNAVTCYECGVQGHFKKDCSKLKNGNHGNQCGNNNAPAKVYVVGNAGTT
ncbi:putative reverse transcriptase domain-containing protein [Tanacetum coccineum]